MIALAALATQAIPAHAGAKAERPAPPAAPPTPETVFSSDRVIVQWAAETDHEEKVDARTEAEVDFVSDLGERDFQLVETRPGQTARTAASELAADPAVAVAEPDGYRSLDDVPNDPLFDQLWGLRNLGTGIDGFVGAVPGDDIGALDAWEQTVGSPSTVIADIDSGYRFNDGDLGPVAWTNPGETPGNGVDDDHNGFVDDVHGYDFVGASATSPSSDNDPTDDNLISGGHGLHTAGTMGAAGNNGVGITGVAQDVSIMPLRVCANSPSINEARCPFDSIVAAINYAGDMHARAANLSLGGNTFTQTEVNAIAAHPKTLYVISAGNDGSDNDGGEAAPRGHHYPCDYEPTEDAAPPVAGAIDNIICVAATDQADGLASFSDWGPTSVDLGAPGTATLSTFSGQETPVSDDFQTDDFSTRWSSTGADGGFARSNEAPLTSFGMTDTPGETPTPNSVREATLATAASLPAGLGACRIQGMRLRKGGSFSYGLYVNGIEEHFNSAETAGSALLPFRTVPITGLGGKTAKLFFRYTASPSPAAGDGVWLDDLELSCYAPLSAPLSYAFLEGTSMAAPHVTGAAGLLFSLKPSATVAEVKQDLLSTVDPDPALAGKTTTGGRLDIGKAADAFAPPVLSSTVPASPSEDDEPRVIGSAEEGSTVKIYGSGSCSGPVVATGSSDELSGPGVTVSVPRRSTTQLTATATDAALNTSACSAPIIYVENTPLETEIVKGPLGEAEEEGSKANPPTPPQSPPASCTVPKLAGESLAQATAALNRAHCSLRKVTRPKHGQRLGPLVVKSSAPAAGSHPASGKVDLTLGPKPKPRKHHH
jgi:subtilisin family serine protease